MNDSSFMLNPARRFQFETQQIPKSLLWEGLLLLVGLLAGAYIHYHAINAISTIMQATVLFLYYRSSKNYPWLIIVFFISFTPGAIFSNNAKYLSLVSVPGFGTVTFSMMFVIVSWLKAMKSNIPVFFRNQYLLVLAYMLILLPIFGFKVVTLVRLLIYYSWLMVVPRLLYKQDEYDKLIYMVFLFNIFTFISNIYQIVRGVPLLSLFVSDRTGLIAQDTEALIRTADGVAFGFLSVIGGLLYLSKEHSPINPVVAYSGLVIGLLNVISSATRGWIISTIFLIITYSFFIVPKVFRNIMIVLPILAVTTAAVWQVPLIKSQISKAYNRLIGFENILNPDFDADTTDLGRIKRGERVMEKFRESPIIGFGFGEEAREYMDGHTGNQSVLLNFGIIGFFLLANLWIGFIIPLLMRKSKSRALNSEYQIDVLMCLSLISVYIIHSTSGAFLHPLLGGSAVFWYGLTFAHGNMLYYRHRIVTRL